jgi:hypothetical protein
MVYHAATAAGAFMRLGSESEPHKNSREVAAGLNTDVVFAH